MIAWIDWKLSCQSNEGNSLLNLPEYPKIIEMQYKIWKWHSFKVVLNNFARWSSNITYLNTGRYNSDLKDSSKF